MALQAVLEEQISQSTTLPHLLSTQPLVDMTCKAMESYHFKKLVSILTHTSLLLFCTIVPYGLHSIPFVTIHHLRVTTTVPVMDLFAVLLCLVMTILRWIPELNLMTIKGELIPAPTLMKLVHFHLHLGNSRYLVKASKCRIE